MSLTDHLPPQPAHPRLNLNGSAGTSLLEDNRKAAQHLYDALEALRYCSPHGRDYIGYPEEFARARNEHWARINAIRTVMLELDLIAVAIDRQCPEAAA